MGEEFGVFAGNGNIGILSGKGVGGTEENAVVGDLEHAQVVVTVASGNDLEVKLLEMLDGLLFVIGDAETVVGYLVVCVDFEFVAEERGTVELLQERAGELAEGVGENDEFVPGTKLVEEVEGAREGLESGDDFLDLRKSEAMFGKDAESVVHECIVVRFVASGTPEGFHAGFLREGYPDFGDKNALEV